MKQLFDSATWSKLKWPLLALGLVLLFNLAFTDGFFRLEFKNGRLFGSVVDVFNRAAPVMLISLGMTLVIATGGVDLSVGAVMAIAGSIAALFLKQAELPVAAIIAISLGAAVAAGLWNGALVGFFKIPPIIATLILMVSGRGIAQLIAGGKQIEFNNATFAFLGRGSFLALPFPITATVLALVILVIFTRRTAAGLFIESTGDNETASRYSGVSTRGVKLLVYSICSLLAGAAGLIATADIERADPSSTGMNLELDAILATVIGGTALTGGRFYLTGSLLGAILVQTLTTTIQMRGFPVNWTPVLKAVVIVAVCLLQSEAFRKKVFGRLRSSPA